MADQTKNAKVRKRSIWPYALTAMFCVHASIVFITMTFASKTPANAEPDYYKQAVDWDQHADARLTAQRQSWSYSTKNHAQSVQFTLHDRLGAPITHAAIKAVAFHRADALDRTTLNFTETSTGLYETQLPTGRVGLWDLRLTIETEQGIQALIIETIEIHQ